MAITTSLGYCVNVSYYVKTNESITRTAIEYSWGWGDQMYYKLQLNLRG